DIELNEEDYAPGEKITIECERCGNEIEVAIPEREEKTKAKTPKVTVKRTPSENLAEEDTTSEGADPSTEYAAESLASAEQEDTDPVYSLYKEEETPASPSNPSYSQPPMPIGIPDPEKKSKGWIVIIVLLLIACGVGGWWYYDNIYLPEKIDREAPR
ncbi:MAG: hypothetical protein K2G23_10905, partial [Muribaculaceae bacterium]|nr:hypothetical protein [Muribaculaceae bacterium]